MSSPKMSATIGWSSSDSAVGVKNVKVVQQKSVCIIPSGVTISKKLVSIEYEYTIGPKRTFLPITCYYE